MSVKAHNRKVTLTEEDASFVPGQKTEGWLVCLCCLGGEETKRTATTESIEQLQTSDSDKRHTGRVDSSPALGQLNMER